MKRTFIFLLVVSLFGACTLEERVLDQSTTSNSLIQQRQHERLGISPESVDLTPEEASIVAYISRYGSVATKGALASDIERVEAICDVIGDTLMYVVQYANHQGYTVVSATKNYYPVLVDVEQGVYDEEVIAQCGASLFYKSYREAITSSKNQSEEVLAQMRQQWCQYESHPSSSIILLKSANEELIDLVESSIEEWIAEGYEYSFLFEGKPEYMPQEVFDQWVEIARDLGNENYDYMANSVILLQATPPYYQCDPMLSTEWGQFPIILPGHSVFESFMLGCGPIAVGQIMAYHRFPSTYNWDEICHQDSFHDTTRFFLKELAIEMCDVNSFGPDYSVSNIEEMRSYLRSQRYTLSKVSHNAASVRNSLQNQRPVLMVGRNANEELGHAWVCDGFRRYPTDLRYTLKVLSYFDPITYETAETYITAVERPDWHHMNWGRNGSADGFYMDGGHNYNTDRQNLVNIRPSMQVSSLQSSEL